MNKWKLKEITYKDVKARRYNVAVLPVGSTEPHGFHLPYGCDTLNVEKVAERICTKATKLGAKVILLPTIPYGVDSELMKFPLAINVNQSTLDRLVTDIVRSLEAHKIFKLLILNGHGGNVFSPLMHELYGKTKVFIASTNWWYVAGDIRDKVFEKKGGHANEMETSAALEVIPELVHMKDAADGSFSKSRFEAVNKGWVSAILPWHCLTKSSGHGDARKSTQKKGKRYLDVTVDRISKFVKELSDSPMSDRLPF